MIYQIKVRRNSSKQTANPLEYRESPSAPTFQDDPESLLKAADAMLYQAKDRGRNRVIWETM